MFLRQLVAQTIGEAFAPEFPAELPFAKNLYVLQKSGDGSVSLTAPIPRHPACKSASSRSQNASMLSPCTPPAPALTLIHFMQLHFASFAAINSP
jgi:hypothetical protein